MKRKTLAYHIFIERFGSGTLRRATLAMALFLVVNWLLDEFLFVNFLATGDCAPVVLTKYALTTILLYKLFCLACAENRKYEIRNNELKVAWRMMRKKAPPHIMSNPIFLGAKSSEFYKANLFVLVILVCSSIWFVYDFFTDSWCEIQNDILGIGNLSFLFAMTVAVKPLSVIVVIFLTK